MPARLEHANITVPDPRATAAILGRVFGWSVRWEGPAMGDGFTVHVGHEGGYLALYTGPGGAGHQTPAQDSYRQTGGLNHTGVGGGDLGARAARGEAEGFAAHPHAGPEPGGGVYFPDGDGLEYEVASYR